MISRERSKFVNDLMKMFRWSISEALQNSPEITKVTMDDFELSLGMAINWALQDNESLQIDSTGVSNEVKQVNDDNYVKIPISIISSKKLHSYEILWLCRLISHYSFYHEKLNDVVCYPINDKYGYIRDEVIPFLKRNGFITEIDKPEGANNETAYFKLEWDNIFNYSDDKYVEEKREEGPIQTHTAKKEYKRKTRSMPNDVKEKIRKSSTGKKKSEEHRQHIREGMKAYWATVPEGDDNVASYDY